MAALARERWRVLAVVTFVAAAAALSLKVANGLPSIFARPALPQSFGQLSELERAVHRRLLLPAYFPSSLRWPPTRLELSLDRSVVTLGVSDKDGGRERLILVQTVTEADEVPETSRPPGVVFDQQPVRVGAAEATLARVRAEDGVTWNEVRWRTADAAYAIRFNGSVEELLRMASSVHREGR